jgi:hypothetical protein
VVFDRGAGCVRPDRLNALLGVGLHLVSLTGGDDLTIRCLEVEPELTGVILADLELAAIVSPSCPASKACSPKASRSAVTDASYTAS